MKIESIQHLIEDFLKQDRVVFAHKKGHRTRKITGKELGKKVAKTRGFLKNKKIKKGDRILILGSNSLEWITVYFACILSGIIVVPLDVLSDKSLIKRIQKQVNAKAVFQDKGLANTGLRKYYLDDLNKAIKDFESDHSKIKIKMSDVLEIIYTSGATGVPKGVVLTNENINYGINYAVSLVPLKIRLKIVNLLPLSHIFGQVYGLFLLMRFNHTVFFIDNILPGNVVSFIRNKSLNGAVLVPGMIEALKREVKSVFRDLGPQFRLIGIGGAPLDIKLEKWWKRRGIVILQGYGLTETSSVVSANKFPKTGSVGKIAVNLKFGGDGEILVKGENVFSGYYQDEEKTRQSFEGKWFKTGDIGYIKNNRLYIKERKKDVIITSGGLKVYPTDIENILNKFVKESCVLEKDKKVHAVLILKNKEDASKIIKKANKKLLRHQKIAGYSVWPYKDFPKTATGKARKFLVLSELGKTRHKKYSYEDRLYSIIDDVLKPQQRIKKGSKLSSLGMDSLKRVELISELEKEFGVEIDEAVLDQHAKAGDLENLAREKKVHRIKFKKWPLNPICREIRFVVEELLVFPLIRIFTKTEYEGLDNIPKTPVIFASNHQSSFDSFAIAKELGLDTAIASDSYYFFGMGEKNPIIRLLRRTYGILVALFFNSYPFGKAIGTSASLDFTGELLDREYSIVIFPEGRRTRDGKIKAFRPGIGYLALNMGVPVVPVKIEGLFNVLPYGHFFPKFGKSSVKFGKPIVLKEMPYLKAARIIEKSVKEL